jgi:hypothetical protein
MPRFRYWSVVVAAVVVTADPAVPETQSQVRFQNIAEAAGIRFVHRYSPTAARYFVESAPGGLAVFDYNGDGRPDIFFTNGAATPALEKTGEDYANRLFRNDGGFHFTDVTEAAGVAGVGYAMGAAAADYDNDGRTDLFVAGVRRNQLLHNRGDGRFEDVTDRSGIASGEWAVSGGWFDYDNDGLLDLFVVNYVQWSPDTNKTCGDDTRGIAIYCHPRAFKGLPNRLYRNRGDGTFEDVSARAGLLTHIGKGMSVAFADYDHDGRLDMFVPNDTVPNFLFHNKGDGTFEDTALMAGVSVADSGRPISSMGTDFQDYDNDGWEDIHVTALAGETFPLFRNDGAGSFTDATQSSGLASRTVKSSGWCSVFADVDNDGWKDLFTANSHVNDRIGDYQAIQWQQPNSLFLNDRNGHFRDVAAEAGFGGAAAVHRGCGVADFDGDGRLDFVVLVIGDRAELWKNESRIDHHWLIVKLKGSKSNRDGIGARVTIGAQVRTMTTSVGYASSSHAGLHFGLGASADPVTVKVRWPSGLEQTLERIATNQVLAIEEK